MKRIVLFLVTNLAVMVVLSITLSILGVNRWLTANGLNMGMLLVFSLIVGFAGSIISLLLSKTMAKFGAGVTVIAAPSTPDELWLVGTVQRLAEKAGIGMPEVGIFESPQPNAFATGARRDAALVAVSSGLLQSMSQQEAEAVLAHEVSHVANGDMVTLALI